MISRRSRSRRILVLGVTLLLATACEQKSVAPRPVDEAQRALQSGDAREAERALEALVDRGEPLENVAAHLGEAALLTGNLAKARQWLAPGRFSPQTYAHGFRMLGRLEMAEGNLAASGRAFDLALAAAPSNASLWVDIGRLRYRGGEQIQAIEAADKALAFDPADAEALQFRGQLARDAIGLTSAASFFERALASQPDNIELRLDLAATLGDAGRAREALAVLRGGGDDLAHPQAYFIQAVIAARGGQVGLSRSLLRRSGKAEAGIPSALMLSAVLDCIQGNYASAAQTLDKLTRLQPDNTSAQELFAFALSRSDGEQELIERFGTRGPGGAGSNYIRLLVGRAFEALDDRAAASIWLDLHAAHGGLTVLPDEGQLPNGSHAKRPADVRTALKRGDRVAARAIAEAYVRDNPGSGDARALLGDMLLAYGSKSAARAQYRQSAQVRQPWSLTLRMLAAQDDPAGATRLLEDYLRQHPRQAAASAMLADAYAAAGDWRRAVLLLDHALANGRARDPFTLAARSVAAANTGDDANALNYAMRAHALQPMSIAGTVALIDALPASERSSRSELKQKLRSLIRQ